MKVAVGNGSEGRLQTWIAAPVNGLWWVEEVLVVLVVVVVVVQRASPGDQTLHHQPEHQVHSSSSTARAQL